VHALKGMLHAHSPPDEEVVVKETDNLGKREGFPRGGGEHIMFYRGEGGGWKSRKGLFPRGRGRAHDAWQRGRG